MFGMKKKNEAARQRQRELIEAARNRFVLGEMIGDVQTDCFPPCFRKVVEPTNNYGGDSNCAKGLDVSKIGDVVNYVLRNSAPFELFGIDQSQVTLNNAFATYQTAKSVFRSLILHVHPDKNDHARAAEAFSVVEASWTKVRTVLKEFQTRYDGDCK